MTMVPSADHHHHQSSLSSSSRQLQRQLLYGGYAGGGCGADYYNYINTAAPDDQLLLMSQVEEGGYDQYYSYCDNNTSITDQSNYLLAAASISSSDLVLVNGSTMATEEDESRTNSLNVNGEPEPEGGETGSSSKPAAHHHHHRRHHHHHPHVDYQDQTDDDDDNRWLQLSIGRHTRTATGAHVQQAPPQERRRRSELLRGSSSAAAASGLIELDLLPSPPSSSSSRQFHLQRHQANRSPMFHHVPDRDHQIRAPNFGTNLYFQNPGMGMGISNYLPAGFPQQHQEKVNWRFRPLIPPPPPHNNHNHIGNSASTSTCSSSSSFMQLGPSSSYFARPFQFLHHGGIGGAPPPGPSLDFRVVDPPRRSHSGFWFMLQASLNQEKEPSLPQIPKSYLRIKDGRMTVRLIKKYLVNKLRLDSESEVEITCRGQQLLPCLTLQHVRDNIWSLRDAASANASLALLQLPLDLSVDDHVMVLHYARTSSSTSTTA